MKLIDFLRGEPVPVAFGMRRGGGMRFEVVRDADSISLVADTGIETELPSATPTAAGVLSAADKGKLDALADFPSRSEAGAAAPAAHIAFLRTAGFAEAGDGGGAMFRRVAADPGHGFAFQTADGSWWEGVPDPTVTTAQFGCDRTGANDTTATLGAFYEYCIAKGVDGLILAGTYLITPGGLAFDNGHVATRLPFFATEGAVTYLAADNGAAPLLAFTNGTASSSVGRYWTGGGHGPIKLRRPAEIGGNAVPGQSGLVLRGVWGTHFGTIEGENLGSHCLEVPRALHLDWNPDPYNVSACVFDDVTANTCHGYAVHNDNYVGLNGCRFHRIRATNSGGVFFGMGAANTIEVISAGSCRGYAVGDNTDGAGGASSRFTLGTAEFDDIQYGVELARASSIRIGMVRFVHRCNFSGMNPGEGYWPRKVLNIGGASAAADIDASVIHRIEAGGSKEQLGVFADFNNGGGNINDVRLYFDVLDNAGLGIADADLYTNFNQNSSVRMVRKPSRLLIDTSHRISAQARIVGDIRNGGFSGTQYVDASVETQDFGGHFDPVTKLYTCPLTGLYRVSGQVVLALSVGQRVRLAVSKNGSATQAAYRYSGTANATVYEYHAVIACNAGDTLGLVADQNSGVDQPVGMLLGSNDNILSFSLLR